MTEIRKVELKAVASEEIVALANKDIEQKDPENAREIIDLCGKDFEYSCEKLEIWDI